VLAQEVIELANLDRLVVVPARRSPLKTEEPAFSPSTRLEMVRRTFAHVPRIEVSDTELQRPAPSYTIDTILELERRFPGRSLGLVIGQDSVSHLHRWHRIQDLAKRVRFLVARRPGAFPALDPSLTSLARLVPLETTYIGISSTQVRDRRARGLILRGFVPEVVEALLESS
jgi:nicotinate-nucleotide adenylyltransferase